MAFGFAVVVPSQEVEVLWADKCEFSDAWNGFPRKLLQANYCVASPCRKLADVIVLWVIEARDKLLKVGIA